MTTLNPWINFNGNAEEAFTFYQSVFGGNFAKVIRFKDLTGTGIPTGDADAEKIMQIHYLLVVDTCSSEMTCPHLWGK
jgi:PhnB protein